MNWLIIILITIVCSAFFSGMEIAFISANKMRLEIDKKQSSVTSKILTIFSRHPGQYITTMLVGNNVALVIYSIAFTKLLEPFFYRFLVSDTLVLVLMTLVSTLIILVTAEFLPKTVFRLRPNSVLKTFSFPLVIFYYLLYPISRFSIGTSKLLIGKLLKEKMETKDEDIVLSRIELHHFVKENHEKLREHSIDSEVKLFRNALDFSKVKIREIMIPRTEIEAMDIEASMEELKQRFVDTGYSRILLYEDSIDNIIGYIHHSSMFNQPVSIKDNLKKVLIVPETMPANKLLSLFIQEHMSMAVVVDEFGGTAGMVTSEDIMEEIFGDIEDEHDTVDFVEKKVGPDEYIFSGRLDIDDLNEKYQLNLQQDENFETLAGYILYHHESIPKVNSVIQIGDLQFKILKATSTRIELVNVKRLANS